MKKLNKAPTVQTMNPVVIFKGCRDTATIYTSDNRKHLVPIPPHIANTDKFLKGSYEYTKHKDKVAAHINAWLKQEYKRLRKKEPWLKDPEPILSSELFDKADKRRDSQMLFADQDGRRLVPSAQSQQWSKERQLRACLKYGWNRIDDHQRSEIIPTPTDYQIERARQAIIELDLNNKERADAHRKKTRERQEYIARNGGFNPKYPNKTIATENVETAIAA